MLAIVAVGVSVGFALTRLVAPKYSVNATIWIAKAPTATGPIASPGLTDQFSWPELARSFIVLDGVVSKLALYVQPRDPGDTLLVRGLRPSDSLVTGSYVLAVNAPGATYTLTRKGEIRGQRDSVVERGALGDSVGRSVGFLWRPDPVQLQRRGTLEFGIVTPREASLAVLANLTPNLPFNSSLMRLTLTGAKPGLLATTMNSLIHEFVDQAGRLKTENLAAVSQTVDEQLLSAADQMRRATAAYEGFKIHSITLPSENTIVAPGVQLAQSPVFTQYFQEKLQHQQVQRDIDALRQILGDADKNGGRAAIDLRSLPMSLQQNSPLADEVVNLETKRKALRGLQRVYTDSFPLVQDVKKQIAELETQTLPKLTNQALAQFQQREREMSHYIAGASEELRQIPPRTVEEQRLQREVDVASKIYTDLQQRAVSARLAKMSALPDISILDSAVAPRFPTRDTKVALFLYAILASIAVAVGLALLLDRVDKRFRYPEQATSELGLDIVGAIPTLTNPRNSSARLQEATQLVEAFRSLSLSLRSAFDGTGTVQFTVSSPGPGDGKSFIAANLASALADGGYRTVLIDGDIRRGALHSVFGPMEQTPGLLDYLAGECALHEIVRSTSHSNLFVVPSGKRRRHGPELVAGQGMSGLVRDLAGQFDALVVDSAPLGAGIDPFALGVATGAMLIVLRTGETDRRLAQTKLEVLDRLPVRVLGTVLNDIGENPQFRYYHYLEGYGAVDSDVDQGERIGAGNGASRA
jgi:tyrosine-protein kinase Etk/Wzc